MARLAEDFPGYPQYPSDRDGFQAWLEAERAFWSHLDAAEDALGDGQIVGVQVPVRVSDDSITYVVTRERPLTVARVPSSNGGAHPGYVQHIKRADVVRAKERNALMRRSGGGVMPRLQPLIFYKR